VLVRHSFIYALARGVPGIVNFLAIVIYTRMMTPGEYGQYALVIAAVGLIDSVLFQWIRLGLLRFLPHYSKHPQVLLSTLFLAFLSVVAFTSLLGIVGYFFWTGQQEHKLLVVGLILLWIQGWYELPSSLWHDVHLQVIARSDHWAFASLSGSRRVCSAAWIDHRNGVGITAVRMQGVEGDSR